MRRPTVVFVVRAEVIRILAPATHHRLLDSILSVTVTRYDTPKVSYTWPQSQKGASLLAVMGSSAKSFPLNTKSQHPYCLQVSTLSGLEAKGTTIDTLSYPVSHAAKRWRCNGAQQIDLSAACLAPCSRVTEVIRASLSLHPCTQYSSVAGAKDYT